jgi:hypothetical protein
MGVSPVLQLPILKPHRQPGGLASSLNTKFSPKPEKFPSIAEGANSGTDSCSKIAGDAIGATVGPDASLTAVVTSSP